MNVGIIGTGMVARALAARLLELGHAVMLGTREVAATRAKSEPGGYGEWATAHPAARLGTFAEAAGFGELLINATSGSASLAALRAAGPGLDGKVLIDISNPLDFSRGMPPTLFVKDTDSLGEMIQREFPAAKVVKSLNTMNAQVMVNPALVPGDHTVFVSGDDAAAKATVTALLHSFGWTDVFDLGGIQTARGVEMLLPLWLYIWPKLGSVPYNFKLAR